MLQRQVLRSVLSASSLRIAAPRAYSTDGSQPAKAEGASEAKAPQVEELQKQLKDLEASLKATKEDLVKKDASVKELQVSQRTPARGDLARG
jgi:ribosomal protein L3